MKSVRVANDATYSERIQEDHAHCGAPTLMLLDAVALEKSEVVANACMNRQRNLAGPNSYEKDLGFAPLDFLKKSLEKQREAAWLDLCCGAGRALIEAAEVCRTASLDRSAESS
jgi:hypothetical protein